MAGHRGKLAMGIWPAAALCALMASAALAVDRPAVPGQQVGGEQVAAAPSRARTAPPATDHDPALPSPGTAFQDCPECPEMVVVPAGSFAMGSPDNEPAREKDEVPQHQVTIARPFAVGKFEVTFAEWDACAAAGGCKGARANDESWGRDRRPVINVTWNDAQSYVAWLSRRSGKRYRLLSEAEWEYAARAQTTTRYWCGDVDTCLSAVGWYYGNSGGRTQPVGSKPANAFGLHDMSGNVWEWVEDCWHRTYEGAPADGRAWTTGGSCWGRVLRGGSWNNIPRALRTAVRYGRDIEGRHSYLGFRVARN